MQKTNLSSSQQSLFSLLWERKQSLQQMGMRERIMEILLLSRCNISSLFAFHSGHCQGRVRFYTQAFSVCCVSLKKNFMQLCVFCRFDVWGGGWGCNSLLWSLSAFSVQLYHHVWLNLPLYHMRDLTGRNHAFPPNI